MEALSLDALEEQILALPVSDQLLLIERLARALRHENDREAFEAGIKEMANDPDIQADLLGGNKIPPPPRIDDAGAA